MSDRFEVCGAKGRTDTCDVVCLLPPDHKSELHGSVYESDQYNQDHYYPLGFVWDDRHVRELENENT